MSLLKKINGHSELLEALLYDLVHYGTAVVTEAQIMRWTNTRRVTYSFWKYINTLLVEILEDTGQHEQGYRLYVGENNDTYTFLIWDRGQGDNKAADRWWQPIEDLAQPKKRRSVGDDNPEIEEVIGE